MQNTLFLDLACRLLLTAYPVLVPLTPTLIPASFRPQHSSTARPQHLYFAAALQPRITAAPKFGWKGQVFPDCSASGGERVTSRSIEGKEQAFSLKLDWLK
jgi:hypothetical protein